MDLRFLQGNLNHSAAAQDLFVQAMAEWQAHIAVAAEPYRVPVRSDWVGDCGGSVAIIQRCSAGGPPLTAVNRGEGFVVAKVGVVVIVGVYFSPNRPLADFERFLALLGVAVGQVSPGPVVVLGDLNAKSRAWGSATTDLRGRVLEEWLVECGLAILNRGTVDTCVRRNGGSVVDVSFATPPIAYRVQGWEVLENEETLSDHRYITFSVSNNSSPDTPRAPSQPRLDGPRWAIKRLNRELLQEAVLVQAWIPDPPPVDIDGDAARLCEAMTQACNAAMPRVRAPPSKTAVYWWNEEIARLRQSCVEERRAFQRYRRRRNREEGEEDRLYAAYREVAVALRLAISRSKAAAWEELLQTLERDPWGRPYKLVRQKLRPWTPPISSSLEPAVLERVVEALFPEMGTDFVPPTMAPPAPEEGDSGEVPEVSKEEVGAAVLRIKGKNTAPGLDGIPCRAWVLALGGEHEALEPRLRALFTRCVREGVFPHRWKEGRLVLLRKETRPADDPSGYRPIVLLDEAGKLLERVVANRLVEHLEGVGPSLSDAQFGFRCGRSTIDAIGRLRDMAEEAVSGGGLLLAVSLDIKNAFNSLPWPTILEALRFHGVPRYLRRLVGSYLSDRAVVFPTRDGAGGRRRMTRGVPQGSVLGPLLWNIGYDHVLRCANLYGVDVICYADDTLVTARGSDLRAALILATAGVAAVVSRIRRLGLEVALHKSEAICFHGPRRRPPASTNIVVGGTPIPVGTTLKYLGVVLDSRWDFGVHLERLVPRLVSTAGALGRLLPNLGGGNGSCRRLYMGAVRSMALYGAPIWAGSLKNRHKALLHQAQRVMAVRAIRGYRTISHEMACVLAGSLPWDLEAEVQSSVYWQRTHARSRDLRPAPDEVVRWRREAQEEALGEWRRRLEGLHTTGARSRRRVLEGVLPILEEWVGRKWGPMTFRLTQILSGHGCFGRYLCNIVGKESTPECHHCGCAEDTAQHTLVVCSAWAGPRSELIAALGGGDLSLPTVMEKMVGSEMIWEAMISFCDDVMLQKETAERLRERDPLSQRLHRGRGGRARRGARSRHDPPGASRAAGAGAPAVH